jgi:inner membrane protein involved in colicin E2 resistance
VASRIAFFAPVSLVFFFTVLVLMGVVLGINLHPMNYFFLAAGCFAFQLLFAYLVDLVPLHLSFVIAAVVSLLLVGGYIMAVGGRKMLMVAVPAQFAYMVLFSYSFFFDGMTGITITIGAILTLALLMKFTAKVNWAEQLAERKRHAPSPPVMPPPAPPPGSRPATA